MQTVINEVVKSIQIISFFLLRKEEPKKCGIKTNYFSM